MNESKIKRISPPEAFAVLEGDPNARLIDVRSKVEFDYVGHPLGALHIPWKEFPDWQENPQFVDAVAAAVAPPSGSGVDTPLLLVCRSGARSMAAAIRLAEHGFSTLYNVEEGFEGDKDDKEHRGTINGWRYHGLPWQQG